MSKQSDSFGEIYIHFMCVGTVTICNVFLIESSAKIFKTLCVYKL